MKQCLRVEIPLEQRLLYLYSYHSDYWCSRSTTDFNSLLERSYALFGLEGLSSWRRSKTFLYFDDSQAARWRWELRPATTLLDFSDLNEILLKNMINNIKTLALSRTWKAITNPISFISLSYHQTDNQCLIWNPSSWKLHSLVFYNYQ